MDTDIATLVAGLDENVMVAQHGPFVLTHNAVLIDRPAQFEEWVAALKWARAVEKASPFWVGDLLAYGESAYGEMYAQALEESPLSYGTLVNAAYVAGAVAPERRRDSLSFAHHQEVAPLPPAEQDTWLAKAETDGLTREQLRAQLKAFKAEASGNLVEFWVMAKAFNLEDQTELVIRMQAEGRATKMQVREIKVGAAAE